MTQIGLIFIGVVLIILGFILGITGGFGLGGVLATIGWILLAVGAIIAIIHAIGRAAHTHEHRH